ncbi:MAG: hypothetical protein ACLGIB_07255 [Actinomycetota bacterium]
MTALIGGSLLLIVAAAALLVVGWVSADQTLIWTSIVASVVAGVLLSLGYYRSKDEAAAVAPERDRPDRSTPPSTRPDPEHTQATPLVTADADTDRVIAYPDRSRFHRPDCRYASLPGGEKLTRETATRRGYDPCGVCKP